MTFRMSLERARRLKSVDVDGGVSSSSSSLLPDDSASACKVVDELSAGAASGGGVVVCDARMESALKDYSSFMSEALVALAACGAKPAEVCGVVNAYTAIMSSCVSASVVSSSEVPISVVSYKSGLSIRSGEFALEKPSAISGSASPVSHASGRVVFGDLDGAAANPGLCYLKFVAKGCRTAAKRCLGLWPTVSKLLAAPFELFDMDALNSYQFTQVASDMWHVEVLGGASTQLSARYALAVTVSVTAGSGALVVAPGTLACKLLEMGCARSSARCVPLAARVGGDGYSEFDVQAPLADWSWAKQFKWCDAHGHCRFHWKYGSCVADECVKLHIKVSPSRLRSSVIPSRLWTKSQRIKWCKSNDVCWKNYLYAQCGLDECRDRRHDVVFVGNPPMAVELFSDNDALVVVGSAEVRSRRISCTSADFPDDREIVCEPSDLESGVDSCLGEEIGDVEENLGLDVGVVDGQIDVVEEIFADHDKSQIIIGDGVRSGLGDAALVTNVMFISHQSSRVGGPRVGPRRRPLMLLSRVSVVNCYGQVVYDVRVDQFRALDVGVVTISDVQHDLLRLCSRSWLVGFGLDFCMSAVQLKISDFPCGTLDVQRMAPYYFGGTVTSLATLSMNRLNKILSGFDRTSVNDAIVVMQLYTLARPVYAVGRQPLPLCGVFLERKWLELSGDSFSLGLVSSSFVQDNAPDYAFVLRLMASVERPNFRF